MFIVKQQNLDISFEYDDELMMNYMQNAIALRHVKLCMEMDLICRTETTCNDDY